MKFALLRQSTVTVYRFIEANARETLTFSEKRVYNSTIYAVLYHYIENRGLRSDRAKRGLPKRTSSQKEE